MGAHRLRPHFAEPWASITAGMSASPENPLVVTLALDAASQAQFEQERRRHFPAGRNQVPAHVSLFHALPGASVQDASTLLAEQAAGHAAFPVLVEDVRRYGSGVGYRLVAKELDALHARLRAAWLPWLTPQDRQGFRPHLIVQNKAPRAQAEALLAQLAGSFRPWTVHAAGISLWRYEGGPWSPVATFLFSELRSEEGAA